MREELRPYENQSVVVRGLLKEATHIEGGWDCLFVTCVWKPVLVENYEVSFAQVSAHKTDHLWVRVSEEVLDGWKQENPSSILLKRLEKVFTVVRYRRKNGSEDFGLQLPVREWNLYSYQLGRVRNFQRELRDRRFGPGEMGWEVWEDFRDEIVGEVEYGGSLVYLPLESKMSYKEAFDSYDKEINQCYRAIQLKGGLGEVRSRLRKQRAKRKAKQKQGPKPGRGF